MDHVPLAIQKIPNWERANVAGAVQMDHASPDTPVTEHLQKLASQGGASVKPPVFVSPQTIEQLTQIVHQEPNEHEITISIDPGLKSLLVICVRSLYSGDVFERVV